jgi:RNA polymerase-binding protein DksA
MTADQSPGLSSADRAELESRLRVRQRQLRAEIARHLNTQDDPRLVGMRNRMEDTDDWAVADAMANMDIASVSRDLSELTAVEAALARLAGGDYGECVDCGIAIPLARLSAYPAAKRCVSCQERAEEAARRAGRAPD